MLEQGELEVARRELEALEGLFRGAGELEVLRAWIERRRVDPGESWLESLFGAWAEAGHPVHFSVLKQTSLEETLRDPEALFDQMFEHPLMALIAAGSADPDRAIEGGLIAAERASSWLDRLWALALLGQRRARPELLGRAGEARVRLRAALAQERPDDFRLRGGELLGDLEENLSKEMLRDLLRLSHECPRALKLDEVYQALKSARRATDGAAYQSCLGDAMSMWPDIFGGISVATSARSARSSAWRDLLSELVERFAQSPVLLEQMCAAHWRVKLANARGGNDPEAEGWLAHLRHLLPGRGKLTLDWPLDSLRREVADAQAVDEVGLFTRCLPPPC
jgi:hypothetical protein